MSAGVAAKQEVGEAAKVGTGLLRAVAAAIVCPFDGLLSGLIRAGVGVEAVCAYLGLSIAALDFNVIRLDLPTPHKRQRRKGGAHAWSDEDLRLAIYWRRLGIHPESIGIAFGRSAAAVRSKMHRLGVPTPDRKTLRKVDPELLDRTTPDFGFPVPPGCDQPSSGEPPAVVLGSVVSVASAEPACRNAASSGPISKAGRKDRKAAVPGQRNLNLLSVVQSNKASPIASSEPASAGTEHSVEQAVAVCSPVVSNDIPRVLGPVDLIEKYQVLGKIRHPDSNEAYVTWMTLLYRGGMHYKAIGAYLGRSPSSVQAILYRMEIPRAKGRSGFGWTCDLECAVAELQQWKFELYRCKAKPDLPETERPLFWRRKGDVGNRKRRCVRLKNKEFDDFEKYLGGNSVEMLTRAGLEAERAGTGRNDVVRTPGRLHAAMQGCLAIQQGAAHEQCQLRGHSPVVRSGLPGSTRDQMSWAHSRNGGPSRPVAHP